MMQRSSFYPMGVTYYSIEANNQLANYHTEKPSNQSALKSGGEHTHSSISSEIASAQPIRPIIKLDRQEKIKLKNILIELKAVADKNLELFQIGLVECINLFYMLEKYAACSAFSIKNIFCKTDLTILQLLNEIHPHFTRGKKDARDEKLPKYTSNSFYHIGFAYEIFYIQIGNKIERNSTKRNQNIKSREEGFAFGSFLKAAIDNGISLNQMQNESNDIFYCKGREYGYFILRLFKASNYAKLIEEKLFYRYSTTPHNHHKMMASRENIIKYLSDYIQKVLEFGDTRCELVLNQGEIVTSCKLMLNREVAEESKSKHSLEYILNQEDTEECKSDHFLEFIHNSEQAVALPRANEGWEATIQELPSRQNRVITSFNFFSQPKVSVSFSVNDTPHDHQRQTNNGRDA